MEKIGPAKMPLSWQKLIILFIIIVTNFPQIFIHGYAVTFVWRTTVHAPSNFARRFFILSNKFSNPYSHRDPFEKIFISLFHLYHDRHNASFSNELVDFLNFCNQKKNPTIAISLEIIDDSWIHFARIMRDSHSRIESLQNI